MAAQPEDDSQSSGNTSRSNFSDLTGTCLGKYRVVEKLGQGGMAQVYKAFQPDLERYVAIKVLHPHLTSDEDFAARFRHEAQAIAALEHPHIVRIYDFETDHGLAFLVMEYLRGISLKARLRQQSDQHAQMEFAEAARIVAELAEALDYAHQRGIIHRDVKPSNVILTPDNRVVLTDFGIARMIDATVVTGSSGSVGTPAYMSPEQAQGEPGNERSDVYALGVVLYQLCTGHLPFDADTPYAIILKHLTAPLPPPRALRPDLPDALEGVILKALAKTPADRFQTAHAMGQAVLAGARGEPIAPIVRPPQPRSAPSIVRRLSEHGRWVRGGALVALVCLIGLVLFAANGAWHLERYLFPTAYGSARGMLTLQGPSAMEDLWLDPDHPDANWIAVDRALLRAAQADRFLIGFDLSRLPGQAGIISATLTLHAEPFAYPASPGKIAAHVIVTPWRPAMVTFRTPWSKPGLAPGSDYDPSPIALAAVAETGTVTLNVSSPAKFWRMRGRTTGSLVLMLSEDSSADAQYWVYTTDHPNPDYRPIFQIAYEEAR